MSSTPRNLPRFLPTLTEVVHPASLGPTPATVGANDEEIIRTVMQQVNDVLENRLREETDAMVHVLVNEHLENLNLRLQQELALAVRQAVVEALERQRKQLG